MSSDTLLSLTETYQAEMAAAMSNAQASTSKAKRKQLLREKVKQMTIARWNAMTLFQPLPHVMDFFESRKAVRILTGSNQCLGGEQLLFDPVSGRHCKVENIRTAFNVMSRNPDDGSMYAAAASKPFVKAVDRLYRWYLSNGETLIATEQHRVVDWQGQWVSLKEAFASDVALLSGCQAATSGNTQKKLCSQSALQSPAQTSSASSAPTLLAKATELSCGTRSGSATESCASPTPCGWLPVSIRDCWQSHAESSAPEHTSALARLSTGEALPAASKPLPSQPYLPSSSSGTYQSAHALDVSRYSQTGPDCLDDYYSCCRLRDEQPRPPSAFSLESAPLSGDVPGHSRADWPGEMGRIASHTPFVSSPRLSSRDAPGPEVAPFSASVYRNREAAGQSLLGHTCTWPQSGHSSAVPLHTAAAALPNQWAASFSQASWHPPEFKRNNSDTQLHLIEREDLGQGLVWDITVVPHANYLCAGLVNANSSKTLHSSYEFSRAVRGCDPYRKYPKKNGRALIIGLDGDHLADPLYTKLFKPGEFQVIRDKKTRLWRAVRPDPEDPHVLDPYDLAHEDEWRPGPALIPPSMVVEMAWAEQKSRQIPRVTKLINGWTILWRSSRSDPPQGGQYDIILADEELDQCQKWIPEMIPRLVKRGGRIIWPATAQDGGIELQNLLDMAEEGSENVDAWTLLIDDNPYISDDQRQMMLDTLGSEDEIAVRYYGRSARAGRRIYPGYAPMGTHGVEPFDIPPDWTRIGIVDPGRRYLACVVGAVDPDEQHAWLFGGFVLRQANATAWAAEVKRRWPESAWDVWIIDGQAGQQHLMDDTTSSVAEQYWDALVAAGCQPRLTGPLAGFIRATKDTAAREEALLRWMAIRSDGPHAGTPTLQIMRGVFPELDRQIKAAQASKRNPQKRDTAAQHDALDCLEYWAGYGAQHHGLNRAKEDVPAFNMTERLRSLRKDHLHWSRRGRSMERDVETSLPGLEIGTY